MQSAVVRTGGMRFGIRMARPKFFAVNGSTALSISPSRTCRCQSSGLRIVIREVMAWSWRGHGEIIGRSLPDRCGGGGEGFHGRFVDHRAGEIGDAGKAALGAP